MSTTDPTIEAGALTAAYQERTDTPRMFLVVHVEDAADRPSWVVDLPEGGEVTFGRSRGATIVVDHEKVSRLHARIRRTASGVTIQDLGSRNGTRINTTKLEEKDGARALAAGDEIAVGPATAVLAVTSRLARRTRIADPEAFEARLAAEVDRAARYQRRVVVAALRIGGDDAIAEAIGRAIRPMDLLADYGGDQYMLALPELALDEASALVRRLIGEARGLGTDVRAGLAIAPDDARTTDQLLERSRAALRRARQAGEVIVAEPPAPTAPTDVVLADPAMKRIYAMIERIADSSLTVLILGETGVGKELIADAIHRGSSRRAGPLVKLNCASLPENLLESELFGHERGAFTGADRRKVGFFEAANSGTLFLDEIGEMQLALQAKMLRVLERKVVTRVGGTDELAVDVRVVCATHRDVEAEVRAGRFREDLYFRIAGFTVAVPPLRDRKAEIVPLAEYFLRTIAAELDQPPPQLGEDAALALASHDWPGNVRELRNAVERALVIRTGGVIGADDLPDNIRDAGRRARPGSPENTMRDQLAELERSAIVDALELQGGNQTRAAQRLGISRRALIYKMEKLGLKAPPGGKPQGS
jgi:DNA-binding NtrC family response regulator/pSer/pThr/pTyr-binding forkhead associated (FHA) protein